MIPFIDLKRELKYDGREIKSAIEKVITCANFILGPQVESLERAFSRWIGVKYAIGVGSGTEALHLSLLAAGVKTGDEVITATNTCGPTISAIMACGAVPVLIDADPDSYCIDISKIEEKITKKTCAIIPVHLYGQPADMDLLMGISRKYDIPVVEDCAHAHGAEYRNRKVGGIGALGCFSFYPTKNMGGFGDGGIITTNNKKLSERCRLLRNYGQKNRYRHELAGFNSRLDELQAAVLNVKIRNIDRWNNKRREIAKKYNSGINNPKVILPREIDYAYHVYHLYVLRVKNRDTFRNLLRKKGISTLVHYPVPMHRQPFLRQISGAKNYFPVADRLSREIVSIPMHPYLKNKEVSYIIDVTNSYSG